MIPYMLVVMVGVEYVLLSLSNVIKFLISCKIYVVYICNELLFLGWVRGYYTIYVVTVGVEYVLLSSLIDCNCIVNSLIISSYKRGCVRIHTYTYKSF